ncbi:uncharacterized protein PpBr36_06249 [Pyricularia pennisetigena]|uniref:uncharacterized protein n=1 Tax=Pyricularia pennisetigena TaxID=1578925 RepID=UPI00114FFB13|nr:uncharacterized protein PpBr36_06249 [Pyricularia pennisetigena]TLS23712.1 hypothetical protein PpBr36_06249 [Pyricularia pennisetigena]
MGSAKEAEALNKPLPPLPGQSSSMLDVGESSRDVPSEPPQYEEVTSPASRAAAAVAFASQECLPPPPPAPATDDPSALDPPPYAEDAGLVQDILIPPGTLRLADKSIFAAEAAPDAAPLYELDQAIGFQRTAALATNNLSRLEHRIKRGSEVATRVRAISELVQTPPMLGPTFPFHARATIAKAHTLGSLGLVAGLAGVGGFRVHRAEGKDMVQREQLFRAARSNRKRGDLIDSYDWFAVGGLAHTIIVPEDGGDGGGVGSSNNNRSHHRPSLSKSSDGVLIARENTEPTGMHTLEILVSLDQRTRDALVTAWCLRLWKDIAARNKVSRGVWSIITNRGSSMVT